MTRAVTEWIAAHDDQAIPRAVKARIWLKFDGRCAKTGKKLTPADQPQFDHIKPLADGGEHRESNMQLLSGQAHKEKTGPEATGRAKERRIHAKHHNYFPKSPFKIRSRGFDKRRQFTTGDTP